MRVLPAGFEPATYPLGGDYSSTELREHTNAGERIQAFFHIDQSGLPSLLVPADCLGKSNRDVPVTLEGFEPSFNRLEGDRVSPTLQSECGFIVADHLLLCNYPSQSTLAKMSGYPSMADRMTRW